MEGSFLKTALLAESSHGDTSLALPNEPSSSVESDNRSLRVKQQVQLSLKRNAKRTQLGGAGYPPTYTANSVDAADESSMKTMVKTSTPLRSNSVPIHAQKSFRRMAVPPKSCQDLPSTSFGAHYNGMNAISVPGCSDVEGTLMKSYSKLPPHCTSLKAPQATQLCSSTKPCGNFSRMSSRQTGGSSAVKVHQNGLRLNQRKCTINTKRPTEATLGTQLSKRKLENEAQEMTLYKAVNTLQCRTDEDKLIAAASYIQNQCFHKEDARNTLWELDGIQKLLQLLSDDREDVQCIAAGALRNVVYQNYDSKWKVKSCDGLDLILKALSTSDEQETKRQLTGLLWNMSSVDCLKEEFPKETAPVLTKLVLVPSSGIFQGENPKHTLLADADAFCSATGLLRNLSSCGQFVRKGLRECENLIDSLVFYIRGTVANSNADDKSTENSVCILCNLTFAFDPVPQQNHVQPSESIENSAAVGCFTNRTAKTAKDQEKQPLMLEAKETPQGSEWLWSPIIVRLYLSLVACSTRFHTQAAAIGALQNTTAGKGAMSKIVVATINKEQEKLKNIVKVLKEGNDQMKMNAICLIRNLSLHHELQPTIVRELLPEILNLLLIEELTLVSNKKRMMLLCQILINLIQNSINTTEAILQRKVLDQIKAISLKYKTLSEASQEASVLLYMMWEHREYQKAFKTMGFKKQFFINKRTKAAFKKSERNPLTHLQPR